jgi:hypothetical protein
MTFFVSSGYKNCSVQEVVIAVAVNLGGILRGWWAIEGLGIEVVDRAREWRSKHAMAIEGLGIEVVDRWWSV